MSKRPEKIYFSLGDRKAGTRNRILGAVWKYTEDFIRKGYWAYLNAIRDIILRIIEESKV